MQHFRIFIPEMKHIFCRDTIVAGQYFCISFEEIQNQTT